MSDDIDVTPSTPSLLGMFRRSLQRLLYIVGAGLVIWLIFGQQFLPAYAPVPQTPEKPADVVKTEPTHSDAPPAPPEILTDAPPAPPPPLETSAPADHKHISDLETQVQKQSVLVEELTQQIEAIQTKNTHQLTALTTLIQLKEKMLRGDAFVSELQIIARNTENPDALALIEQLKPSAEKGIASWQSLKKQFDQLTRHALAPNADAGWLTQKLYSVIRIRKTGEQTGDDDESILARAETKLSRGDLSACLTEMMLLSQPTTAHFSGWITLIKNRISAASAVDALQLALLDTTADPKTPPQ